MARFSEGEAIGHGYTNWQKSEWVGQVQPRTQMVRGPRGAIRGGRNIILRLKAAFGRQMFTRLAWPVLLASNSFLRSLYDGDAWLSQRNAKKIGELGFEFLVQYAGLARMADGFSMCSNQNTIAYTTSVVYLICGSAWGPVLNPLVFSAQADEDFIGRPSCLAQRVTPKLLNSTRTVVERYLQSANVHWVKESFLVPSASSGTK